MRLRLKEILAERRKASAPVDQGEPATNQQQTDNNLPLAGGFVFSQPMTEFQALFEGVEDY